MTKDDPEWIRLYIAAKEARADYEQAEVLGNDVEAAKRRMYALNAKVREFAAREQAAETSGIR